ncbi:D-alanyl-D-alanine carboxypeptidase [Streptomyces sp. KHY 26]|uniref:D-alanyl-D-alanine carboxypeptidase n=1 Tax=Streptomyces sp. KHY 26 TaxID=3097359 RepID=UPI00376EFDAA
MPTSAQPAHEPIVGTWHRKPGEAGDDTRAGRVRTAESSSTGAIGLSGLARTDDGEWRVFSFIENGATADPTGTKDAMDGPAATVNGCWA